MQTKLPENTDSLLPKSGNLAAPPPLTFEDSTAEFRLAANAHRKSFAQNIDDKCLTP